MQNLTSYPVPDGFVSEYTAAPQACQLVLSLVESPAWWDWIHTFCLHAHSCYIYPGTGISEPGCSVIYKLVLMPRNPRCQENDWKLYRTVESKEHSGDTFFHRERWHEEGELPTGEAEGSPQVTWARLRSSHTSRKLLPPPAGTLPGQGGSCQTLPALQGAPCMCCCQLLGDADIVWARIRKP